MNTKSSYVTDPVCKMTFAPEKAAAVYKYNNTVYYFCNPNCKQKFAADPESFLSGQKTESCCCCSEAFEDDEQIILRRKQHLLINFILASIATVAIISLNHINALPQTLRGYLQLILAAFTVFIPGGFLFSRGVKSLIDRQLNMFTLISMGVGVAFFYSVYAFFFAAALPESLLNSSGAAKLHFQAAGMITALVILGQYLEARASAGASRAIRALMELIPPTARRIKKCCGSVTEVALSEVQIGDYLQILPHDKIPVDGRVIEGSGAVDESMLTGESLPVDKNIGSKLAAGTLNGNTVMVMQAEQIGQQTLLSQIVDLVKSARRTKLPIQQLADKVSSVFVPAVLTAALIALLCWGLLGNNWGMGLSSFISVLLAACPCSLGLAAPLAVMVGVGVGARHGILVKNPAALEVLRKIDTLMLDKTGTLTENTLQVKAVYIAENVSCDEFYTVLFALECNNRHPLAQAVMAMDAAEKYREKLPEVEDYTSLPGQGVSAIINDLKFVLGSSSFLQQSHINVQDFLQQKHINEADLDQSVIMLGAAGRVWGMVCLEDVIRPDAQQLVTALKMRRIDPVIISGDTRQAVRKTAYSLGIEEFFAQLTPQQKLQKIQARQAFGRYVAMIGDGVNDAAALAAADVSVAMGSGADAALASADITLLGGNISKLRHLLMLGEAVNRTIKQNLALAFAYNIILIPLAAGAFYNLIHWQFSPVISSIAMSGSCLLVVFNALRLWKIKLQ